ncbi:MAG TPA: DUF3857 domain-containing protein [Thermoanaerobaculia bacterium]|nr:DUF3857 domain-containing protein [Thermoanaerobaculia bacterium]
MRASFALHFALLTAGATLTPTAAWAASPFAPVTEAERALKTVPGHPNAPAVVLFKKGDFRMLDPARGDQSSSLEVAVRLKILSAEGVKQFGEVAVPHSRFFRLKDFRGRTVLPDGRELPLDEKSIFERTSSKSRRFYVTTATFPSLEVGAILDYRYQIRFDTIYYLEPWVFQDDVPVLHSEIVYHVPSEISARAWSRDPIGAGIQHKSTKTALGTDVTVWAENLPPFFDEPSSFPAIDLASRFMLVPTVYGGVQKLLDSWRSTCELVDANVYDAAIRNGSAARRRAAEIVRAAGGRTLRDKVEAVYRFVRDEIETVPIPGVLVAENTGPDTVLKARRGDYADKGLMLYTMLKAEKVDVDLVWAASRSDGIVDAEIPTFSWFDRILMRVNLPEGALFLDPSEKGLGFGQLLAEHEGTKALVYDRKKPEVIDLPTSTSADNTKVVKLALTLDEAGRLTGRGTLTSSGQDATRDFDWARSHEKGAAQAWTEWLEGRLPGFGVRDVQLEEKVDSRTVAVSFTLEQREEEVLGDEQTLALSRPFGPLVQPLPQRPEERRTPVWLDYAYRTQLVVELAWPAGWQVEARPEDRTVANEAGSYSATLSSDPTARTLRFERQLEVKAAQFLSREGYVALRGLYDAGAKSDAQALVLVRR